jgi:hypothetical protein
LGDECGSPDDGANAAFGSSPIPILYPRGDVTVFGGLVDGHGAHENTILGDFVTATKRKRFEKNIQVAHKGKYEQRVTGSVLGGATTSPSPSRAEFS